MCKGNKALLAGEEQLGREKGYLKRIRGKGRCGIGQQVTSAKHNAE